MEDAMAGGVPDETGAAGVPLVSAAADGAAAAAAAVAAAAAAVAAEAAAVAATVAAGAPVGIWAVPPTLASDAGRRTFLAPAGAAPPTVAPRCAVEGGNEPATRGMLAPAVPTPAPPQKVHLRREQETTGRGVLEVSKRWTVLPPRAALRRGRERRAAGSSCGQQLRAAAAGSTDSLHLHHLQWLVALAALQKPPHASKG